jgi:hypothetical protein
MVGRFVDGLTLCSHTRIAAWDKRVAPIAPRKAERARHQGSGRVRY